MELNPSTDDNIVMIIIIIINYVDLRFFLNIEQINIYILRNRIVIDTLACDLLLFSIIINNTYDKYYKTLIR